MGVYIKNWSLADWKELLKWAKIGANNAMIGEFSEVEEVPPHGNLIDEGELLYSLDASDFDDSDPIENLNNAIRIIGSARVIIPGE